ncbi:DUF3164 family protein [Gallaecimonas xiamenensis]|uniref:Sulfate transport protein CysZ n=1 Tax=Gallaecimonas xiamenensis 3-C-1 TaxID=745411 RepID=K2JJ02_9GAMM|nr:DUF3164 family protein [Gallaecimonas xiamenensis]EKE75213.1 hypothetical protein B3C1_08051 [Gallaecimonas xiamenensis 3-C-1]
MSTNTQTGYRKNALGHLVPEDKIKPIDVIRDDLVMRLVQQAQAEQQRLAAFKAGAMSEIASFVELSAEQYNVNWGGRKGNVSLTSYDGEYQVQLAQGEHRKFDERIQAAKSLIDQCIGEWSEGASSELRALIDHAFRVNKEGHIDVNQVLSLRKLSIEHPTWLAAMDAIADSINVVGTSSYLRLYQRDEQGRYKQLSLDIAKL